VLCQQPDGQFRNNTNNKRQSTGHIQNKHVLNKQQKDKIIVTHYNNKLLMIISHLSVIICLLEIPKSLQTDKIDSWCRIIPSYYGTGKMAFHL